MKKLLLFALAAALAYGAKAPLYVFENGVEGPSVSAEQEAALVKRTGYAGIFYEGVKDIPERLAADRAHGLKPLGIFIVVSLSDAKVSYDPGLPEAIRQLKGTGALISFAVDGKAANGDDLVVPAIREIADMAAQSGLKVALYPHYGMYMARIEDGLRLREKAGRKNVGITFNMAHWIRTGDEANLTVRLKQALPYTLMVSVNGADHEGDWDRMIQPLDQGAYDVRGFVKAVMSMGYKGPFALQCYNIKGDQEENLKRSMAAWRSF